MDQTRLQLPAFRLQNAQQSWDGTADDLLGCSFQFCSYTIGLGVQASRHPAATLRGRSPSSLPRRQCVVPFHRRSRLGSRTFRIGDLLLRCISATRAVKWAGSGAEVSMSYHHRSSFADNVNPVTDEILAHECHMLTVKTLG